MKKDKKDEGVIWRFMMGRWFPLVIVLGILTFWGGLLFVAGHFIAKAW